MLLVGHTLTLTHDSRLLVRPLLALVVLWFLLDRIYRVIRPRERFSWKTGTFLDRFQVLCDLSRDETLGKLKTLFPERHQGAIVLLGVYFDWNDVRSSQAKWLVKVLAGDGISMRKVVNDIIVLAPDEAARLLGRLDDRHLIRGNYVVLPHASAEEAERFAVLKLTRKETTARREALAECGFFHIGGIFDPFEAREFPENFQNSVVARLRKMYDGDPPGGVEDEDFASLLRVDPFRGSYELLAERRRQGPRLWALPEGETDARGIEFSHGRWSSVPAARTPSPLLPMSWPRTVLLVLLLIVFVLPGLVIAAPFWPLDRWLARRREEKLRRAREALQ